MKKGFVAATLSLLALAYLAGPAAAHWEPARAVDNAGGGFGAAEFNTALAAGANGLATALFFQTGPGTPAIRPYEIRRARGAPNWNSPAEVTTPAGSYDGFAAPDLAAGSDGGALGVFYFLDSSSKRMMVATSWGASAAAPDGAVPAVTCPSDFSGCPVDDPQVALDGAGNGYAAGTRVSGDVLLARRDAATGTWGPAEVVAQGTDPDVAVNAGGDVVIVYRRADGQTPSRPRLYGKRRLAGEPDFGSEHQLSGPNSVEGNGIRVGIDDPFGDATAVFSEGTLPDNGTAIAPEVTATIWPRSNSEPDEPLPVSGGSGAARHAVAAVDPEGRVTVAWQETVTHGEVLASELTGLGWSAPATISASNRNASNPKVAVDSAGTATVVYTDQASPQGGDVDVKASRRPTGGSWSAPVPLRSTEAGAGAVQGGALRVAAGLAGLADFVFVQQLNGANHLFATRFDHSAYPRPGGATPLRVPLVPAFAECESPNSTHAEPLGLGSCTPSALQSSQLTTSAVGRGKAFAGLRAIPGNVSTPANEADVGIDLSATDVRKASDGSDYSGKVILRTAIRITDRANPNPEEPGTVQDTDLSFPIDCVATSDPTLGGSCSLNTTANTVVPGFAQEGRRTVISTFSLALLDAGGDGSVAPPSGACPPTCGSGDEATYLRQGVFAP